MEEIGLKVTSITITGMHRIDKKKYDFNDDITYFIGENGAGKSTILEATQLALLGYIPGYSKTNESIMKHASGPVMSVEAVLDNGIIITRTWTRSGSSVKSTTDVTGYEGELTDLMGQVDLPVFDFNEFKSMTSNKLKDWFISFLPDSEDGVDILKELKDAMGSRAVPFDYLIEETDQWIKVAGYSGLTLVRELNTKFKSDQAYVKGQISSLEGTIKSLIKYDDALDLDTDQINSDIAELNALKTKLMQYQTSANIYNKTKQSLEDLKKQLPAERVDDDTRVAPLKQEIEQLTRQNDVLRTDYNDLVIQINALNAEKSEIEQKKLDAINNKAKFDAELAGLKARRDALSSSSSDACPLTNQYCQTAAELGNKVKEQIDEIAKQIVTAQMSSTLFDDAIKEHNSQLAEINKKIAFKYDEMKECDQSKCAENDRKIVQLQADLGAIYAAYDRYIAMELQLSQAEVRECPTTKTISEIDNEIKDLNDALIKIEANKRYEELSDKVTADKFKFENELEVYKAWTKLTDANGLQTTLMNKPFEDLACDMSKYLSQMFNTNIKAKFNLVSKANSFSFGLERDDQYIEFDYLSSGERCLFTLALIMCILDRSNSEIRTILIDDILDHLDDDNAKSLFVSMKEIKNIQFILAGVKECADKSICKTV